MKTMTKIETVMPQIESGTSLELTHGTTTIFAHNQVWFELNQKYSEWGFLQNPLSNTMTAFLALYTNFKANMGEQFYRMWDALHREYNPLNNYEMIESGADGTKVGTTTSAGSNSSQTDAYRNAFDNSTDTHVAKDSGTASSSNTVTLSNDKSLSFKRTKADGTDTSETLGNDFASGTEYRHTRSGNIGVTTNAQMIQGELEVRETNLLKLWVETFIREYFTYAGERE